MMRDMALSSTNLLPFFFSAKQKLVGKVYLQRRIVRAVFIRKKYKATGTETLRQDATDLRASMYVCWSKTAIVLGKKCCLGGVLVVPAYLTGSRLRLDRNAARFTRGPFIVERRRLLLRIRVQLSTLEDLIFRVVMGECGNTHYSTHDHGHAEHGWQLQMKMCSAQHEPDARTVALNNNNTLAGNLNNKLHHTQTREAIVCASVRLASLVFGHGLAANACSQQRNTRSPHNLHCNLSLWVGFRGI